MFSLFIFAPIGCGDFMLGPCFIVRFLVSIRVLICNHLAEEERGGCFTLIMLWLTMFCVSSSSCHGLVWGK